MIPEKVVSQLFSIPSEMRVDIATLTPSFAMRMVMSRPLGSPSSFLMARWAFMKCSRMYRSWNRDKLKRATSDAERQAEVRIKAAQIRSSIMLTRNTFCMNTG